MKYLNTYEQNISSKPLYKVGEYLELNLTDSDNDLIRPNIFHIDSVEYNYYYKDYFYLIDNDVNYENDINEKWITSILIRRIPEYEITANKYNL